MQEVAISLDACLSRSAIEFTQDVQGMMAHREHDMRWLVVVLSESQRVDNLTFADQEPSVIFHTAVGKPCGVQSHDSKADVLNSKLCNISKTVVGGRPVLTVEVGRLEVPVAFLAV